MTETPKYKRILLKLSGEILAGEEKFGISSKVIKNLVQEVVSVHQLGVQIGLVIGGGNIFRGIQSDGQGIDRASGDYMGMLATCINALALQDVMEQQGVYTRVMSAINMPEVAEQYIRRRAIRHLEKNRVIIFSAGTGNPYFTTDTAASLRAMEMNAEILLKGTKVDAVYDKDPKKFPDAKPYKSLSFMQALQDQLKVMDATAISLCMDNKLPIKVFDVLTPGNLKRIVTGEDIGTLVN